MTTESILKPARATEAGHWYDAEGRPAYEVKSAKGDMRPTTLRDARKLNLVPSVSAIIKCANAPALNQWMQEQVLLAAMTLPRKDGEPDSEFIQRVMADSREQAIKARDRGTAIHAAIQGHYEGESPSPDMWPTVKAVRDAVDAAFGPQEWFAEQSFTHPSGYGGKCDLRAEGIVIDFKTKDFTDPEKKMAYDEHAMQLAAYRAGFQMPEARCANVFVSTSVPGLVVVHEWPQEDLNHAFEMFCGLLRYWQSKNRYRFTTERRAA